MVCVLRVWPASGGIPCSRHVVDSEMVLLVKLAMLVMMVMMVMLVNVGHVYYADNVVLS